MSWQRGRASRHGFLNPHDLWRWTTPPPNYLISSAKCRPMSEKKPGKMSSEGCADASLSILRGDMRGQTRGAFCGDGSFFTYKQYMPGYILSRAKDFPRSSALSQAHALSGNFLCTPVLASTFLSRWLPSRQCRTSSSCWLMIMLCVIFQEILPFFIRGMETGANLSVFRPNPYQLTAPASTTRPTLIASQTRGLVSIIAMSPTQYVRPVVLPY